CEPDLQAWPEPDPARASVMERAATHYGVPLVSLKGALELGVLGEWGVARDQIQEVEAWVAATAAPPRRGWANRAPLRPSRGGFRINGTAPGVESGSAIVLLGCI